MVDVEAFFKQHGDDEYLKDQNIKPERRLHRRRDMNAFLLLDRLIPKNSVMIDGAQHDVFYLNVAPEELGEVATEEDILDLIRCGVHYDDETDSLAIFA